MNRLIVIILLILVGCNKKNEIRKYQDKIINEILSSKKLSSKKLKYKYFKNAIIEEVSEIENGKIQGKIIQFSSNGLIKKIIFINKDGDTVGDETVYNDYGNIAEHFFRLDLEKTLFYANFFNDGTLNFNEGSPYFIQGTSEVKIGDTLSFYIAAPLIPKHKTHITFFEKNIEESRVDYINDIRQLNYKLVVPPDFNKLEFTLCVEIKNSKNNVILKHCDDDIKISVLKNN